MAQLRICCISILLSLVFLPPLAGCRDLANVTRIPNRAPVANAGPDQEYTAEGEMTVTLDGSASTDADGALTEFTWLSANVLDEDGGGVMRTGPDPDDVEKPEVTLAEGVWMFTLWVEDDKGDVSAPDSVVITVGEAVDPRVTEAGAQMGGDEPGDP